MSYLSADFRAPPKRRNSSNRTSVAPFIDYIHRVVKGRLIQKGHLLIFFLASGRRKFEGGAHSSIYGYLGLFLGVAETTVGSPLC